MEIDNGLIRISFTQEETKAFTRGGENGRKYFSFGFTELLTKDLICWGQTAALNEYIIGFPKKVDGKLTRRFQSVITVPFIKNALRCLSVK